MNEIKNAVHEALNTNPQSLADLVKTLKAAGLRNVNQGDIALALVALASEGLCAPAEGGYVKAEPKPVVQVAMESANSDTTVTGGGRPKKDRSDAVAYARKCLGTVHRVCGGRAWSAGHVWQGMTPDGRECPKDNKAGALFTPMMNMKGHDLESLYGTINEMVAAGTVRHAYTTGKKKWYTFTQPAEQPAEPAAPPEQEQIVAEPPTEPAVD